MTNKQPKTFSTWESMGLASTAGMMAVTITHPLDLTKTRLQLDRELQKKGDSPPQYRNWRHCFTSTYEKQGIRGLQRGLSAALVREAVFNGVRIGLYDPIRNLTGSPESPPVKIGTGLFCGAFGAAVCNPLDLLKVRFQSGGGLTGHQFGYDKLSTAAISLWQEAGMKGLMNGIEVNMTRGMLGPGTQLPTYTYLKEKIPPMLPLEIPETSSGLHITCAFISAGFSVLFVNPVDVVRTRLYNQPRDPVTGEGMKYRSGVDTAQKVIHTEGFLGFYKGALTHFARLGPHMIFVFVFLEKLKELAK